MSKCLNFNSDCIVNFSNNTYFLLVYLHATVKVQNDCASIINIFNDILTAKRDSVDEYCGDRK